MDVFMDEKDESGYASLVNASGGTFLRRCVPNLMDPEPYSHLEQNPGEDAIRISKRVKIFDSDRKDLGYTWNCQRCTFV